MNKNEPIMVKDKQYWVCPFPNFTDHCDNGVLHLGKCICMVEVCLKSKYKPYGV